VLELLVPDEELALEAPPVLDEPLTLDEPPVPEDALELPVLDEPLTLDEPPAPEDVVVLDEPPAPEDVLDEPPVLELDEPPAVDGKMKSRTTAMCCIPEAPLSPTSAGARSAIGV